LRKLDTTNFSTANEDFDGVTKGGNGGHLPPDTGFWGRQIEVGILCNNYEM